MNRMTVLLIAILVAIINWLPVECTLHATQIDAIGFVENRDATSTSYTTTLSRKWFGVVGFPILNVAFNASGGRVTILPRLAQSMLWGAIAVYICRPVWKGPRQYLPAGLERTASIETE